MIDLEGLEQLSKGSEARDATNCDSSTDENADPIYRSSDIVTVAYEILKVASPATVSAVLCQLTTVINTVYAGRYADKEQLAGMGLGHAITQSLGLMIFLGYNTRLATMLSQEYGIGNLTLCGQYINQAHLQNLCLFVPVCLLLVTVAHFLSVLAISAQV